MTKECLQLRQENPTWCFTVSGSIPCLAPNCAVNTRVQELKALGIIMSDDFVSLLFHSTCRISSVSQDNEEFKARRDAIDT